ncbi:hypothetical protein NBRC110019_21480 [Neptunitalea chrysea]|uniref:PD-(D/E)XK endonuclease-like domain-containing protein n=1 Tax=Neptunitalea chrysea TaxID=1647581 RepID=A0A9W6EWK4_9FLAO|nr:PD-(D/E)XK nuclease family protein [Neptunitalea chrysea]GLB53108.1 hypothetical protein NBRC110019_21480 [Neptunitalea chrysea]
MKSFLEDVAIHVLNTAEKVEDISFILPSKRAGVFLKNAFIKNYTKTGFSPAFISIESFIENISGLKYANNIQLLFELYSTYLSIETNEPEDFYSFSKWGQLLLQDFNEVDRYLVDPETVFPYLASIKEMNHWSLEAEQTELQKRYIDFWNGLSDYYYQYKENLQQKGIGYQGMIYKEAIENLEFYQQNNPNTKHVFVGFNALNKAEEKIIQELLENGNADIYWDIDNYFLKDEEHDAGLFIRKHFKTWKYFQENQPKWICNEFETAKEIQLIGIPKNVGQAKYTGALLEELYQKNQLKNTVVVLGDETLLTPVLNEIPNQVQQVNITMGLPLTETPIAAFFSLYFQLYLNPKAHWYYKDVLNVLTHHISRQLLGETATEIINFIQKKNKIQITPLQLKGWVDTPSNELEHLFSDTIKVTPKVLVDNCFNLISALQKFYETDKTIYRLELEYLYRFYTLFNQLYEYLQNNTFIGSVKTLYSIYKELISTETLDFQGEPLDGIQIMGMLESRNLDFETIILTAVNEGILPSGKSNNSFIPFDIKNLLEMPTYKEKDAVYTYHFYRLLQRAKNIYILYNTEIADALKGGEKSRFIMQLQVENLPQHTITNVVASPEINIVKQERTIQKDAPLVARLKEVSAKGYSPSSLTNYIRNPLDFYLQSVLGIRQQEEVEETIAANTLGTIIHNTLEDLYKPFEGKVLSVENIQTFQKGYVTELKKQFADVYKGADYSKGKNLLIYNVANTYVKRFLESELNLVKNHTVKVVTIEGNYKIPLTIEGINFPVHLIGKVDRVDEIDGQLRIVDYKSGRVESKHVEIVEWEELIDEYTYSKAFQILAYAYMRNKEVPFTNAIAGIISFKNLQAGFLQFCKKDKRAPKAHKEVLITQETLMLFEQQLHNLIKEIVNPTIPFTEKEV